MEWLRNDVKRSGMTKDMFGAIYGSCKKKEMSVYSAAAKFNVPRKRLDDRIKGHIRHDTKSGRLQSS